MLRNILRLRFSQTIKHKNNAKEGAFEMFQGNKKIGEMTYVWNEWGNLVIDHSEVDEVYKGKGLARKLLQAGVKYARQHNKKIVAKCSYAAKTLENSPEMRDVLK